MAPASVNASISSLPILAVYRRFHEADGQEECDSLCTSLNVGAGSQTMTPGESVGTCSFSPRSDSSDFSVVSFGTSRFSQRLSLEERENIESSQQPVHETDIPVAGHRRHGVADVSWQDAVERGLDAFEVAERRRHGVADVYRQDVVERDVEDLEVSERRRHGVADMFCQDDVERDVEALKVAERRRHGVADVFCWDDVERDVEALEVAERRRHGVADVLCWDVVQREIEAVEAVEKISHVDMAWFQQFYVPETPELMQR
eukprot:TRINITY_DN9765_c0_g1_i1.p1 TRINITY_DN9765_c0_g1~~TRINITY_DN9765_c0_g1_i1.p1  ORF type:complete len:282 (-),score=66.18 TRINITY_DN9765_c0_g1_i1:29-808(-)